MVEWLVSFYNYFELGCPTDNSVIESALGPWHVAPLQLEAARGLFTRLLPFCRLGPCSDLSRGRFNFKQALDYLQQHKVENKCNAVSVSCSVNHVDRLLVQA